MVSVINRFCKLVIKVLFLIPLLCSCIVYAQTSTIANNGWAQNSVNTVIFRKNALVSFGNTQYAAFYDADAYVVIAKRKSGSTNWIGKRSNYKGDATDAHKSISIMVDGEGYLHVAWGHHNEPLNYCMSIRPGGIELGPKRSMTGANESKVTYPEFYRMANGNLLFFYRDGQSGNGSLILDAYNLKTHSWKRIQDKLIDGEGQRNAYWQIAVDKGIIHLSWVWRESPDVASNHDLCYALSKDGGLTWQKSTGEKYQLPITAATAEYACKIPQNSELINQTSMFADAGGQPYIATYWREQDSKIPQYHIVYKTADKWHVADLGFRKTAFSLSGSGTKSIPISRPQIVAWKKGSSLAAALIFRDDERDDKVSIAVSHDLSKGKWQVSDLTNTSVGSWEPTYDTQLWKQKQVLDLFVQKNIQVDGEGKANLAPQPVQVLECQPGTVK
ncbi:BNR repeat-containing protein [Mucilaginibacter sp. KACC 22063]|uniref:BNR repeat-containing protein n=1 Tax=Mucilaginibacter sp. KACC 22063 TaxID=3025666 RepID=UPI00236576AB|nr:BNR repeat-containing protein [Mucilaginibacter sp. KACC 22063]WDF56140.1 BNR repeat-containing protein [Mucilaginibacter sp. KACC 22063]